MSLSSSLPSSGTTLYFHFTLGGAETMMDSILPPFSPNLIPRSYLKGGVS